MPADASTAVRLLTKGGVICQQTNELDSLTPAEQGGALDGERVLRIDRAVGRARRARHIGAGAHPREIAALGVPAVRDVVSDLDVQRYPSGTVRRVLAGRCLNRSAIVDKRWGNLSTPAFLLAKSSSRQPSCRKIGADV